MTGGRGNGYDGLSMSNNARSAYDDGAVPLSGINAAWVREHDIGCTVTVLKDLIAASVVQTSEWHHTSRHYNETEFYRPKAVREAVAALTPEAIAKARAEVKAAKSPDVEVHRNCTVEWLEWDGSRSRPTCEEYRAEGATVTVKGQTATVRLVSGHTFTKRLFTRGFSFESAKARREREVQRKRAQREYAAYWKPIDAAFKAAAGGAKFEKCSYFDWRDTHDRDSSAVTWSPVAHGEILTLMRESGGAYAERTVERLAAGDREVVRVGLRVGIRRRVATGREVAA